MTHHPRTALVIAAMIVTAAVARGSGDQRAPQTAQDVLARAVAAHGGDRLSSWRTLRVTGTIVLQDGIAYKAAYTLLAESPGRLWVEHDLTADRGRAFYEYFLNDGVAWTRRNLVPAAYDASRMKRLWNQCAGVAYYAQHGSGLVLGAEAEVVWPAVKDAPSAASPPARHAYVLSGAIGDEKVELFIDTGTFYLLKEQTPIAIRLFTDFKTFGGVVWPTRVLEIARTRQGESQTPITYRSVAYDRPVESWRFTEDMPAKVRR